MKKLLSLLSISTLTASLPTPLFANASQEQDIDKTTAQLIRTKRQNKLIYEKEVKIKNLKELEIENIQQHHDELKIIIKVPIRINKKNLEEVLKERPQPENDKLEFILPTFSKNNEIRKNIEDLTEKYGKIINQNNNRKTYKIQKSIQLEMTINYYDHSNGYRIEMNPRKIFIIKTEKDRTDDLDWVKQRSQFNLVDSSKTKTWTRPDLIAVDDELNIAIANPNIDKVIFDNVQQSQTNKQWNINVKPGNVPRDHNLQVFFTLNGKPYTSEITVSMQAKIDLPTRRKQENLSDVIKFADDNNLGNILDNDDETIISVITQKNSLQVDFSQIEFDKKDIHSVTLTAKPDSKSYEGSVDVTYNVVPATIVNLKIDLKPISPTTQVDTDYIGQIDTSTITTPVNTFYYANSESRITILKPTASSVITGVVYGCDEQWNKTSQHNQIDPTNGVLLDGSQLATSNGKYVVELLDNLGHTNNIYLQIAPKQAITKYLDTDNGKQFEQWAKANGHDNIRGTSARQLNKLLEDSKKWQQLESDSQFANAIVEWFKTNGKIAAKEPLTKEQVIEQLQTQMPKIITIDKADTSNYDATKVAFSLNQNEIKPNEPVNITVLYGSEKSDNFTLQIENTNPPIITKVDQRDELSSGSSLGLYQDYCFLGDYLKNLWSRRLF
ncbi:adhesin [Spiroplasma endosymbiont of 'Nebria riversi']|uniref:adhesin n=1 Tax=Spiroplasma endosymbiont of 'Nebria riversi' TaxID=2792084 RepID=UPI001C04D82C|nr:adhesin [Spiroplasma endosymbiont of 'Nebria riversi']